MPLSFIYKIEYCLDKCFSQDYFPMIIKFKLLLPATKDNSQNIFLVGRGESCPNITVGRGGEEKEKF